MKKIEFIAPVEAMRGNLSGNQKLDYAENNNPAYDAPENARNYARNYTPRFIGSKRASDGLKYFATKTKSATTTSVASLRAMARLAGAQKIYSLIAASSATPVGAAVQRWYDALVNLGMNKTFRQALWPVIYNAVRTGALEIRLTGPVNVTLTNPFSQNISVGGESVFGYIALSTEETDANKMLFVGNDFLYRFFQYLNNPAYAGKRFMVDDTYGFAAEADPQTAKCFLPAQNAADTSMNLTNQVITFTKKGDETTYYLLDSKGNYMYATSAIKNGQNYTTTTQAPE